MLYKQVSRSLSFNGMATHGVKRRHMRRKKINKLLLLVSLVFFLSWTPIHIFNIFLDSADLLQVLVLANFSKFYK